MTASRDGRNPFHVLGLPASATNAQIVQRAQELVDTHQDTEERDLAIWAKGELITHPLVRAGHERTEPARTDYDREQRWQDFVHDHRHPPIPVLRRSAGAPLRPADFDLAAVARILIRFSAAADRAALTPLLQPLPLSETDGIPRPEVRDVLFG